MQTLKKLRVSAGLTQMQVADAMGVSQPNYQRWEAGSAPIPTAKHKKLARILNTSVESILGKPVPFDLFGVDKSISDERTYFGEVAIHFQTSRLLLPISDAARTRLYQQLHGEAAFIFLESLDNRIVFMRRHAITDLYLSSDAYDDYGPEDYDDHLGVLPDDDFWKIIECAEFLDEIENEWDPERVAEVMSAYQPTDASLDEMVEKGILASEDRVAARVGADQTSAALLERATTVCWQLSSGPLRREHAGSSKDLYESLSLTELDPDDSESMIHLPFEGYHRTVMINKKAIDFLIVPKHKYEEGRLEVVTEAMEE